ncbi:hypothetical protein D1872_219920 [compost metagenome]
MIHAVGNDLHRRLLGEIGGSRIVRIKNGVAALLGGRSISIAEAREKQPFRRAVFFHGFVIVQMILRQVGEYCRAEFRSFDPALIQRVRGNLHDAVIRIGFDHLM